MAYCMSSPMYGVHVYDDAAISAASVSAAEAHNKRVEGYRLASSREILAAKDKNDSIRYLLSKGDRIITSDFGLAEIGPCEIMSDGRLKGIEDRSIERFYNLKGSRRAYATPGTGSVIVEWKPASNLFNIMAIPDISAKGYAVWLPCQTCLASIARK